MLRRKHNFVCVRIFDSCLFNIATIKAARSMKPFRRDFYGHKTYPYTTREWLY